MIASQGRQADWRRANSTAYECHKAVGRALKRGDLVKQPCQVCGATDETTRIDAHHEDYSKPLEVDWLCRSHHMRFHKSPQPEMVLS